MFLRSRSVVRHSCSGLMPHRSRVALMRSESRERVSVFYQSPPPITMLTPDLSVCLWGRSTGERGEEQHCRKLKACCGRSREGKKSSCVQMFRWEDREERWSLIDSCRDLLIDMVLLFSDVAHVYEHPGSKSVSATTKSPLDSSAVWFCKTTSASHCIYNLK